MGRPHHSSRNNLVRPALYYPYIHIRSEHWLKATLLCAPAVKRIVPEDYEPEDTPNIAKYTRIAGPHGHLLQAVPAYSIAADKSQRRLLEKIKDHLSAIKKRYERQDTLGPDEYWIHDAKFNGDLLRYLIGSNLAWHTEDPHHPGAHGHRNWYALHPVLGSAIMTTLGLSIAREQQFDVVTPNPSFHETLLSTEEDGIFEALLDPSGKKTNAPTNAQTRNDLGQLVISLTGVNYQALSPEDIPEIQASKHFTTFQTMIRKAAQGITPSPNHDEYKEILEAAAGDIIEAWDGTKQDVGKTIKKALSATAYSMSSSALTTYFTQANVKHAIIGAGVGVGIKFLEEGVKLAGTRGKPRPYQYLTEVVNAQREALRLTFPLGLDPSPRA